MDIPIQTAAWLIAVLATLVLISVAVYSWVVRRLLASGGRVATDKISPVDMGVTAVLGALFIALATEGFHAGAKQIHVMDIVKGSVNFVFLLVVIAGFLLWRRVNLVDFFGMRRVGFWRALGTGIGMLMAAFPLVFATTWLTQVVLHLFLREHAESQEIVKFFAEASSTGNFRKVAIIFGFAVLFGPACEELIFRGYIYPVFKRYLGMWTAVFMNAALFGFMHANLASLPALCLLAVCFTIAYETTGSLVVPYVMHATFNFCQLGLLFFMSFNQK